MKLARRIAAASIAIIMLVSMSALSAAAYDGNVTPNSSAPKWSGTYTFAENNAVITANIPIAYGGAEKLWEAHVGNGTVAVVDGYVYTYNGATNAGGNGTLYKIDEKTGTIVAELYIGKTNQYQYCFTIYGNGLLYIGCPNAVICVDPASFTLKWMDEYTSTSELYCPIQLVNGYVVTRGYVYNATTGGKVKNLDEEYSWTNGANGAECNGYYYVAGNGKLYAFNASTWAATDVLEFDGRGAGVMYFGGRLYWGGDKGNFYSVKVSNGIIDDSSRIIIEWGGVACATPVAANNRVYLPATQVISDSVGIGVIGVFDANSLDVHYIARLEGTENKLQATPVLRYVTSGGSSWAGEGIYPASVPQNGTAYVYVQDYAAPSSIYVLQDTAGQTSGSISKLIELPWSNYAFEQFACASDGAIYCTNDSGYLFKYGRAEAEVPAITKDLDTAEVIYKFNDNQVRALKVEAEVSIGSLSYQWQIRGSDDVFKNISGATASSYIPAIDTAGTLFYRCIVTNKNGNASSQKESKIARITVASTGDVNGDGRLTPDDATALRKILSGIISAGSTENADVNGDNKVSLADLISIRRCIEWGSPLS